MRNDLEKFKQLKQKIEDAKIQTEILKGKIGTLSNQLRQYGFKNIRDVKRKLPKLKRKVEKDKKKFNKLLVEFEKTFFKKEDR